MAGKFKQRWRRLHGTCVAGADVRIIRKWYSHIGDYGRVAQLAEQLTLNLFFAGSAQSAPKSIEKNRDAKALVLA